MFSVVNSVYPFKNYIYTLYLLKYPIDYEAVIDFCKKNKIEVVTMPYQNFNNEVASIFKNSGIKVYVHTVNDIEVVKKLYKKGVYGFYTDSLLDFNEEQMNN